MLATSYHQYEMKVRSLMTRLFARNGFDARRDIAGIILNPWGHAYVCQLQASTRGATGSGLHLTCSASRFGRVAFANSELNRPSALSHRNGRGVAGGAAGDQGRLTPRASFPTISILHGGVHVIALRLLFVLMVLTLLVTPAAAQKRPFQLTDMSSLQNVSDPQLSPDGTTIAYVRSRSDYATDRQTSDVTLAATAGGAPKATFAGSSPRWSPDAVAFMGQRNGRSGIFIRDVASGAERFLVSPPQTDHWLGRSPKNWAWSPNGSMIAYVSSQQPGAAAD